MRESWEPVVGKTSASVSEALDEWAAKQVIAERLADAKLVCAAARVAAGLGIPLAGVIDNLADALARRRVRDMKTRASMAGPRATIKVLLWLPLAGIGLGMLMGADPLEALVTTSIGRIAAIVGIACVVLGFAWTRTLILRTEKVGQCDTVCIDLLAAGVKSGAPLARTMTVVGQNLDSADGHVLEEVGALLQAGRGWDGAWHDACDGGALSAAVESIKQCGEPAWRAGVAPSPLLESASQRLNDTQVAQGEIAVARLGVSLMLPLGVCFLPAFICLGLVPTVVSLASDVLQGATF
jgi:tight adherence protein B